MQKAIFYFFYFIDFLITIAILYWIISAATKSKERLEVELTNRKLLIEIAKKLGSTTEEINQCLYH